MEIGSEKWKRLIIDGAGELDIHVDPNQAQMFAGHAEMLLEWNRKTNLTAITDPMGVAVKHFLDALILSPLVLPDAALLDIGSGAGFPGVPLKILRPSLRMTLIDAKRKKVSFLKHVIRSLGLDNIAARHMRAEELVADPAAAGGFDIIISRALSSLEEFVTMAAPLLAADGKIVALKGPEIRKEIESMAGYDGKFDERLEIGDVRYALDVKTFLLPYLDLQRLIIILKKA
jgi:16S rRNA (guanine527-N7)-methyltransferase